MSRYPPPPRGHPPSWPSYSGRSYGGASSHESYDSYRPAQSNIHNSREPIYQFGAARHDSYAPGCDPYSRYGPPNEPYRRHEYGTPYLGNGDSYYSKQPGPPYRHNAPSDDDLYRPKQSNFSFRYEAPSGVDFRSADTYHRRSPPRGPRLAPERFHRSQQITHNEHNQVATRGSYRGRGALKMASDRAFLKTNRAPTPEMMPGMNENDSHVIKYIPFEKASDEEEAISDAENEVEQPRKKQARTECKASDGDSVPKWSNPDPYTALPPPDDSQHKRKDVVKLIRKARVTTGNEAAVKAEATEKDFISFDLGADIIDLTGDNTTPEKAEEPNIPDIGAKAASTSLVTPSSLKSVVIGFQGLDAPSDPALGNRKRTIRDEIVGPPNIYKSSKGKNPRASGCILQEWAVSDKHLQAPWLNRDHSETPNMAFWLHKEIIDWYNYVKPRDFEHMIRTKLIEDLSYRVRLRFPDADVHSFGSFPAGLYLPVSDIDLVFVSDRFMNGSRAAYVGRSHLQTFRHFLMNEDLALEGSIDVISGAKVPLVKYVDKVTGLRIDISFENDTGLIANQTFQAWKSQFPAMPILVTLIKHMLVMRGLNEPANGGIGGFSVTCLVVSLLQNMPQVQSRNMVPEHHLGECLMEFLELYGKKFDFTTTGIELNPPGYFLKTRRPSIYKAKHPYKICIIDPNKENNDIAGGSINTPTILQCFSNAFNQLQQRMSTLYRDPDRRNQSILACVMAGNYSSFELQRNHLAHVHHKLFGSITAEA